MVRPAQDPSTATTRPTAPCRWPRCWASKPRDVAQEIVERLRPGRRAGAAGDRRARLHQPAPRDRLAGPPGAGRWPRDDRLGVDRPTRRAPSSSTTARRTSPSRCTSATCAARSSATPWPGCCASWATGHHRQPPRRLGHAVRHAAVRLQALPRRGGVAGRPGARAGRGCTSRCAQPDDKQGRARTEEDAAEPGRPRRCPAGDGEAARRRPGERPAVAEFMPWCLAEIEPIYGGWTCTSTTRTARASTTRCCRTWSGTCWTSGIAQESQGARSVIVSSAEDRSRRRWSGSATGRSPTRPPTWRPSATGWSSGSRTRSSTSSTPGRRCTSRTCSRSPAAGATTGSSWSTSPSARCWAGPQADQDARGRCRRAGPLLDEAVKRRGPGLRAKPGRGAWRAARKSRS